MHERVRVCVCLRSSEKFPDTCDQDKKLNLTIISKASYKNLHQRANIILNFMFIVSLICIYNPATYICIPKHGLKLELLKCLCLQDGLQRQVGTNKFNASKKCKHLSQRPGIKEGGSGTKRK